MAARGRGIGRAMSRSQQLDNREQQLDNREQELDARERLLDQREAQIGLQNAELNKRWAEHRFEQNLQRQLRREEHQRIGDQRIRLMELDERLAEIRLRLFLILFALNLCINFK